MDFASNDFFETSYSANILVNGISIWNSSATLSTTDNNGSTLTESGTSLGIYNAGSNYFNWSPYSNTLNLGTFLSGEEFTLDYYITTNVTNSMDSMGDFTSDGYGWSYAEFGDPNGISSNPINEDTLTIANTVSAPEPSGVVLLGAGLAGLAFRRRAKKTV